VTAAPAPEAIAGRVVVLEPIGAQQLLTVRIGGDTVKVTTSPEFQADAGEQIWLRFNPDRIRLMDAHTGAALLS